MNNAFNVEINNPEAESGKITEQEEHIKKILRALFDLTKKQIECYLVIRKCQDPSICVNNLVGLMASERSIIQKHMKVLFNKELITRKSVTLTEYNKECFSQNRKEFERQSNRGYLFVYNAISNQELQERIDMTIDTWKQSLSSYFPS